MIRIELAEAGKKFQAQWIFRKIELSIAYRDRYAITGFNGSGKSTLLQVISGFLSLTEGKILFTRNGSPLAADEWYRQISYAAPYLDLPEEYNMHELFSFYASFKPFSHQITENALIEITGLQESRLKPIKHFSSGMKQRIKLALAVLSDAPVLLLDEPLSNLDKNGFLWYKDLIQQYTADKTIIVCSNNIEEEIFFCDKRIDIHHYKV
ncbi:MAG: ABC transporter ATP-binding protein [Bacteroidia bacterium]|nr:ABC transporter ATP-binding protein [Bacteroidia bacterium]